MFNDSLRYFCFLVKINYRPQNQTDDCFLFNTGTGNIGGATGKRILIQEDLWYVSGAERAQSQKVLKFIFFWFIYYLAPLKSWCIFALKKKHGECKCLEVALCRKKI